MRKESRRWFPRLYSQLGRFRLGNHSFFAIAGLIFVLDQATKLWVSRLLEPGQSWPIINGILHLTYVRNPGAAFGILAYQTLFFVVLSALMVLVLIAGSRYIAPRHFFVRLALSFLLGGVLGNLGDRLRSGYVIDFIDFRIWPVFNVADVAIVAGILFILTSIFYMKEKAF